MLTPKQNPIFEQIGREVRDPTFDCTSIGGPHATRGSVPDKREIRKFLRVETASEAIGPLYNGCAIFGITKGQFSLIEMISAVLEQTGPAHMFISTWTAAGADLNDAFQLIESGKILSARFLVDHTFQRRKPAFAARIRDLFGPESVRVTKNHAKFCLLRNEAWDIVIKTSMNLNTNARLEDFDIQDDKRLADFLEGIMNEIFARRKKTDIDDACKLNAARFKKI